MHISTRYVLPLLAVVMLFAPSFASAQILSSFGGRVLTVLPCISPLGPSLVVTVRTATVIPLVKSYIWTPATITKLVGPPVPGGQVLGLADVPYACWNPVKGGLFGLFTFLSYSYGQRMTYIGTSLPGLSNFISGGGSFGGGGATGGF
jgi:uncharacterized membrane protein YgcG